MKSAKWVIAVMLFASLSHAAKKEPFYIYADQGARVNHFAPSGWMGDYGDLKVNIKSTEDCIDGRSCTRWDYTAKRTQGAGWAGVFYQHPPNNWGEKPGGYDLTGYTKLTFWARGAKGGEVLKEVKVGGITGEFGDSGQSEAIEITLTKEWKKYTIPLKDVPLNHIIGGFCWVTAADVAPEGLTFWLDEVRFEL